jgi:uncharacterized protein with PhoU and TrkA domain
MGLEVLGTFSIRQTSFMVGAMCVAEGSELDGQKLVDIESTTRVIAVNRPDAEIQLHPQRDARLCARDTVYLVGPHRELLDMLRRGLPPKGSEERPSDGQQADVEQGMKAR